MAVNISIDASILNTIDIADVAAADDKLLFNFFADGVNVFNKASANYGGKTGDVIVTTGVKYTISVTSAQAKLLKGISNTYLLFKQTTVNGKKVMLPIGSGTVTVTNLGGTVNSQISFTNAYRQRTVTDNYSALPIDDFIFVNAAGSKNITLPDNTLMIGKKFSIKKLGAGDVVIKDKDAATIYTLDGSDEHNVDLIATAFAWVTFN